MLWMLWGRQIKWLLDVWTLMSFLGCSLLQCHSLTGPIYHFVLSLDMRPDKGHVSVEIESLPIHVPSKILTLHALTGCNSVNDVFRTSNKTLNTITQTPIDVADLGEVSNRARKLKQTACNWKLVCMGNMKTLLKPTTQYLPWKLLIRKHSCNKYRMLTLSHCPGQLSIEVVEALVKPIIGISSPTGNFWDDELKPTLCKSHLLLQLQWRVHARRKIDCIAQLLNIISSKTAWTFCINRSCKNLQCRRQIRRVWTRWRLNKDELNNLWNLTFRWYHAARNLLVYHVIYP